ncbi:MAG: hypothetical protein HY646_05365 [Acidobacteria bacterium]|nr:hypothetical protein [Acidobacteriota bacterium]
MSPLIDHFFSRFFDKDSISEDADERANVVQIVAMLALPGAVISLFMIADHPYIRSEVATMWARSGDRYGFVCYAMVVMGFVMTFKWDSLFPDRRDYLILTSLPISLKQMFAAKVIALCKFLAFFVVAINFFSCLFIPYIYVVRNNRLDVIIPSFVAHTASVMGGSAFMALFFAAFQGVLINLMTPAAFRKISPLIQMISMTILVTALLIIPGVSGNIRLLVETHSPVLDYIPLFWFMGIYEVFNPEGTLIPQSYVWARTAVDATVIVALMFILTYFAGYHRQAKKVLEGIESDIFPDWWWKRGGASILNTVVLRHAFQRASFHFIGGIVTRSSKHRLFIAMYSGIGLALTLSPLVVLRRADAFPFGISQDGLLEAPLVLSFFVVSGLRATFNIPYELPANWMFQITSGSDAAEYLRATRLWVFLRGIVPLYALLAPLEFVFFDIPDAVFHICFGLVVSAWLTELLFFNFNKVPFTCSYLPAKSHLAFLAGAYLYGFTMFTSTMAGLQRWASSSPFRTALFFAGSAVMLITFSMYRRRTADQTLTIVYEDQAEPLVRQLNLSS